MRYGDIKGKDKVYSEAGEPILGSGERVDRSLEGVLHRGWIKYKLGWRTILFKGFGTFYLTNKRIIYIEEPKFVHKIHTFNIDHEVGDFGGWDYHAHRMRRAAAMGAFIFFELPLNEIAKLKPKGDQVTILAQDEKNKYKIVVDQKVATDIEKFWGVVDKLKVKT